MSHHTWVANFDDDTRSCVNCGVEWEDRETPCASPGIIDSKYAGRITIRPEHQETSRYRVQKGANEIAFEVMLEGDVLILEWEKIEGEVQVRRKT